MKDLKFICVTLEFNLMSKILRRYFLRKKEKRLFLNNVSRTFKINPEDAFGSKPQIEIIETLKHKIFLINGVPLLASLDEDIFPTLLLKDCFSFLPKIVVDMNAVPYICRGADIMAPGIVQFQGDFQEKNLVLVLDERNRKSIAIARSLFDSKTAESLRKGKIFKNLHYVGDDIWNVIKGFSRKRKS